MAPLPAVEEFKGYESVLPGAAERIMKMAELNAKAAAEMTEGDATATRARHSSSLTLFFALWDVCCPMLLTGIVA